jgi:hypothetical protein
MRFQLVGRFSASTVLRSRLEETVDADGYFVVARIALNRRVVRDRSLKTDSARLIHTRRL